MLAWFAQAQHASGAIPASPIFKGSLVLFDYNAYWIQSLYEYVLHSGDVAFAREVWPNLDRLMGWYAARTRADGLLVNDLGPRDYGYVRRRGNVVAYYNAQYALALRDAIRLAVWAGETQDVVGWLNRANSVARAFTPSFWDATGGRSRTRHRLRHPSAGRERIRDPRRARDATEGRVGALLPRAAQQPLLRQHIHRLQHVDTDDPGRIAVGLSVHVVRGGARPVRDGLRLSALDLIRREWGYMLTHGPKSTMWETIGALGTGPINPAVPSWDHGWSSGAAPALTEYVLGVEPTSPGFTTFTVDPHPGDLEWASGTVPTPHGPILVSWRRERKTIALHVTCAAGNRVAPRRPIHAVNQRAHLTSTPGSPNAAPSCDTTVRASTEPACASSRSRNSGCPRVAPERDSRFSRPVSSTSSASGTHSPGRRRSRARRTRRASEAA